MGCQIIRQPDDRLALFSSVSDGFVLLDATDDEVVAYFVDEAKRRAEEDVRKKIAHVRSGHPEDAYYQFARTWEEARKMHNRNFPKDSVPPTPAPRSEA